MSRYSLSLGHISSVWSITRSSWAPPGPLHPISGCTCGQHLGWKHSWQAELCQVCSSTLWSSREVRRSFWYLDKPQRKQRGLSTTSHVRLCQQQGWIWAANCFPGCPLLQQAWKSPFFSKNHHFSLKILSPVSILSLELVTPQSNVKKQSCSWGDLLLALTPQ